MKKIEASRLNRSLKEVLDGIANGEKFEITRYGKTVAKLVPPNSRDPNPHAMVTTEGTPEEHERAKQLAIEHRPTPEQTRQKQRDFLLGRINKPPKT